jgi:hypothetical protein
MMATQELVVPRSIPMIFPISILQKRKGRNKKARN